MNPFTVSALSVVCLFVAAPAIVFGFVLLNKRGKNQLEALRLRKEMLELEVEKERIHALGLAEENRKYDRIIAGSGEPGSGR